jgi:hypothetical protein
VSAGLDDFWIALALTGAGDSSEVIILMRHVCPGRTSAAASRYIVKAEIV